MRKLVFAINLTLDGCCDHTKGIADADVHNFFTDLLLNCGTLVYGRKTYQLMVPFWPDVAKSKANRDQAMNDFADAFVSIKDIVVFSRSMNNVEGEHTKVVHGDLREEILALKRQQGKKILTGGVEIPTQLIQLDLVDEYCFVIQPLVVGEGRRLLENITMHKPLQFIGSRNLGSGSVVLHYAKDSR